jgi:endonuclease YncB( thermonuclease family)
MLGITLDEVIERGKMAKKRLNEIVENQKVSVRIEKRGKFGRHVGELLVDNVYPAESLIEEDLAFDY